MSIRSQKMAQEAYPLVSKMKNGDLESKYRTLALTFPSMILQAGLIQAVGFLKAKGEKEHTQLLNHLAKLLLDENQDKNDNARGDKLYETILRADLAEYQLLTRKALDASSWLKRYTQALLEKSS